MQLAASLLLQWQPLPNSGRFATNGFQVPFIKDLVVDLLFITRTAPMMIGFRHSVMEEKLLEEHLNSLALKYQLYSKHVNKGGI